MGETLKPCPFCGGQPRRRRSLRDGCSDGEPDAWAYFVGCVSCAAQGGWAKTPGNAEHLWNTRAAPREPGPDLGAFARAIYQERAGWDGGDLQDLGVRTGVLVPEQRTESCGAQCACAAFCGPEDAPWTCYRLHPSLLAAPRPDAGEGGNA